jgi:hypothetical protein
MEMRNENSKRTQVDIDERTEGMRNDLTRYENELHELVIFVEIFDILMDPG